MTGTSVDTRSRSSRGVPPEERVVVAHAEHPAGPGDVGPGGEPLQLLDEVVDRLHRAVGAGEQVRADRLRAEPEQMAVAVEEAGHQGAPGEVGALGAVVGEGLDLGARADGEDPAVVADRDGLGSGAVVVHRDDRTTGQDASC